MIAKLIEIKDKISAFYAKGGVIINHVLTFVFAFLSLFYVGKQIGFGSVLSNPLICFAVALVLAFLPVNATVVVTSLFVIINLFSLSIELAIIATIILLVAYLVYFRFAPKTGFLLLITPLLFYIKMPYLLPIVAGLTVGLSGIIPLICGTFIFYVINFGASYSNAITTLDLDNIIQNVTFIFDSVIKNTQMIIIMVTFSVTVLVVYLIRKLSVKYSWIIAIIAGCVLDAMIQMIAFTAFGIEFNVLNMILGHVVAVIAGLLMHLFLFSVDYSATEYVQFEDNDYYYYVKAVPKMSVSSKNVTVKTINSRTGSTGFVHTESGGQIDDDENFDTDIDEMPDDDTDFGEDAKREDYDESLLFETGEFERLSDTEDNTANGGK